MRRVWHRVLGVGSACDTGRGTGIRVDIGRGSDRTLGTGTSGARQAGRGWGIRLGMLTVGLALLTSGCAPVEVPTQDHGQSEREQTDQDIGHAGSVPHLHAQVIHVLPHDSSSFTEGLEIDGGVLYESGGEYGSSKLRATDLRTGRVLAETRLSGGTFAEGITVVGSRIWQLTYREGVAILRDRATLAEITRVSYPGEGWGLCHDGARLVMSNGSARLTFRDPTTFAETGSVAVTVDGKPVNGLNELECAGGQVWANVYGLEKIVRIDPATGRVTAVVDASGLLPPAERSGTDVLNGIAAVPAPGTSGPEKSSTDEFLLTGKYWPHMYQVRFVPSR